MYSLFAKKPRLAFSISILIVIAGLVALHYIPTNLLPDINKPLIKITTSYPSASPTVLENSFLDPVEAALNGVKGMDNIRSFVTDDGHAIIRVMFNAGTSLDKDQINIQNRIASITSTLPSAIQDNGVYIHASSEDQLMVIALYSPDNSLSPLQLSDYATRFLAKPLSRINGVSDVDISESKTLNIALNINKMHALGLTLTDVRDAIQEQNQNAAVGSLGNAPAPKGQTFTMSITTNSLLTTPEQFNKIILRASSSGGFVRLKDIATISVQSDDEDSSNAMLNGKPTSFINIYQRSDANALSVADHVNLELKRLSKQFPGNVKAKVIVDGSQFIQVSINEVIHTLFEAVFFVALIIFIFLQNWRATLVPIIAIPVSLIGSLIFMYLLGISINTISLFALILSIGIIVDDAIIVIENVERHIINNNLHPKAATTQAMREITGPILVTTCILLSVFLAVTFLPGIQGKILKQFALVISISVIISAFTALTLSPALCATLLKGNIAPTRFMMPFKKGTELLNVKYVSLISKLLRHNRKIIFCLILALFSSTYMLKHLHSGFLPDEDQGYLQIYLQLPQAISKSQTDEISQRISKIILKEPGVASVAIIPDTDSSGSGILGFIQLTPWSQRTNAHLKASYIGSILQKKLQIIPDSDIFIYNPPLIHNGGMGKLNMELQSVGSSSLNHIADVANTFTDKAENLPEISKFFSNFDTDTPNFTLDRNKAKALGISFSDISQSLGILGTSFVSRLYQNQQIYDVNLEAAYKFRKSPESLNHFYLKNDQGKMVPLSLFTKLKQSYSASWIPHYNLYRSASLRGTPAPGYSTSQAISALDALAEKELPKGFTYTWSGSTIQQIDAAKALPWLFALAIVIIYLSLVALYESWCIPFSVLIVVPVAILGATIVLLIGNWENNLYTQIGMLLLIGMTAKSTILMTEFAIKSRGHGKGILEAAHAAAKLRFRPVIMTSLSFILGVIPLLFATGPGANSRFYLGVTITSGMVAATIVGTIVAPSSYAIVQTFREKFRGEKAAKLPESSKL